MEENSQSRKARRETLKRKRTDTILNILISIVFLLILIVGWNVIFSQGDTDEATQMEAKTEISSESKSEKASRQKKDGDDSEKVEAKNDEEDAESEEMIVESDDPNVIKAVVHPDWEPIGTQQTGEHITQYDEGSRDRIEMEEAISYASGVERDNMIVWWLENGGAPDKVIGTISTKDQTEVYRVYIEWIDGKGWKPVRLEQLRENDKK